MTSHLIFLHRQVEKEERDKKKKNNDVDDDSLSALWVKSSLTQTYPGPIHVRGAEIPYSQRRGLFFFFSVFQVSNPKPDTLLS